MLIRGLAVCGSGMVLLTNIGLLTAQTTPAPTAYSVTANNTMAGPVTVVNTYRLDSKAVVNERTPAPVAGGFSNIRTFYDLQKMVKYTWDPVHTDVACIKANFTGDWGDPFAGADDLNQPGLKQVGVETLHGFSTRIVQTAPTADGAMKAWVDTKTGMVVKAQLLPPGGAPITMTEVTSLTIGPPPASEFALPANCHTMADLAAAAPSRPPGETDEIAALTGDNGQNYVNAIYAGGGGSQNSCSMIFRVVHAGTMEPLASGFQVAVDLDVLTEPSPSYTENIANDGRATFKGGGLHEIASPGHNGVFRVGNVPKKFRMDAYFGQAGEATADIYRECFAPTTVLLYVVKNPASITDGGDWLWVKAGKYATPPH